MLTLYSTLQKNLIHSEYHLIGEGSQLCNRHGILVLIDTWVLAGKKEELREKYLMKFFDKNIDVVIFDMDGTIFDTERLAIKLYTEVNMKV